jgi:hypothetical protein
VQKKRWRPSSFSYFTEAYSHIKKGIKLENSSWEVAFQESHVQDKVKRSARMMHIKNKVPKATPSELGDPALGVKFR